jgi:hypothetical protein
VLLPFAYQIVSRKTVLATVDTGTIHNIGYDGVLVEIERRCRSTPRSSSP